MKNLRKLGLAAAYGRRIHWVALMMLVLALFGAPGTALAHAGVVRSEPPANATLATAPQQMRLWFSEPVSPQFTLVQLLNAKGERLKVLTPHTEATQRTLLTVALPTLPSGVYNLTWETLSDVDGHITQGHIVFGVGAGVDPAPLGLDTAITLPWLDALLRWLTYGAQLALLGAIAIGLLIFDPMLRIAQPEPHTRAILSEACGRVWVWATFLALTALCIGGVTLAWQVVSAPLAPTLAPGGVLSGDETLVLQTLDQLLSQTGWGIGWLVHQVILLALLLLTYQIARTARIVAPHAEPLPISPVAGALKPSVGSIATPLQVILLTGLGMGLAVSQVFTGHAAGLPANAGLAISAATLHLLAASLWVGGLLALCIGLLPFMRKASAAVADLVLRCWQAFSRLALLSVGLVVATGLYSAGRQVASVDAALTTLYGQVLLSKIGLVLGVGFVGLLNSTVLHPGLGAPLARLLRRPKGWTRLQRTQLPTLLVTEVALGLLVLMATGLLTSSEPAHGTQFAAVAQAAKPAVLSQTVEDLTVTFTAQPNQPGVNHILLHVVDAVQAKAHPILRVIAHFTYTGQAIGTDSVDALATAPGEYAISGSQLSIAGPWQIDVVVRRKGLEDSLAKFNWSVAVAPLPVRVSNQPLEGILTLVASLLLLLLSGMSAWWWLRRSVRPMPSFRQPDQGERPSNEFPTQLHV